MSPSVQAATRDRWPVSAALGSARMRVRAAAASSRAELNIINIIMANTRYFPQVFLLIGTAAAKDFSSASEVVLCFYLK